MAGFIGSHVARQLASLGMQVTGLDNFDDYYAPSLKKDRLLLLGLGTEAVEQAFPGEMLCSSVYDGLCFVKQDIRDAEGLERLFAQRQFHTVIHLAAQAGVRYSIQNPKAYIQSNVVGFMNVLEASRAHGVQHLVYASSSSVYGNRDEVPFHEDDRVDHPISMYAASKKSNELMAHVYSHLYGLPTTGLRFFTVYGPWGRPDMAPFLFTKAVLEGKPIKVFNQGDLRRDFTYIDDIVAGIVGVVSKPVERGHYAVFNIGNNQPVQLMAFIRLVEKYAGREAVLHMYPMQEGDVYQTYASIDALQAYCGYAPTTTIEEGLARFVQWYKEYYKKE